MANQTALSPFLTPRQKAREVAFQILFSFENVNEARSTTEAQSVFKTHYQHFSAQGAAFELPGESKDFCERLIIETLTHLPAIDEMLKKHAINWRMERFASTDKAFLRLGAAELMFFKDIPAKVTLEEIIELSKAFGEADTPKFINGILDPISKEDISIQGKVPSV